VAAVDQVRQQVELDLGLFGIELNGHVLKWLGNGLE